MTNEQLAVFIQQGGNDELAPILWERVRKLLYMIADKYYGRHCEMCVKCGVTVWDLRQQAYSAYLGAVKAYSGEKGYQFTAYLDLQFKATVRPLFGKDLLNSAESLNTALSADDENGAEVIDLIADNTAFDDFKRIDEADAVAIVQGAVGRLPDELKDVIHLRYYENLSIKATAHRLAIAENEALNRERRALRLLRQDGKLKLLAAEYRRLGLL